MKKILLVLLLSLGLHAEPYIGFGGMFTDKEQDNCRAYVTALAGYQVNDKFAIEGRYYHVARGDAQWAHVYAKVKVVNNFYGLVGWEKSLTDSDYAGLNFGAGYTINKTSFELGCRKDAAAPTFNVLYRF